MTLKRVQMQMDYWQIAMQIAAKKQKEYIVRAHEKVSNKLVYVDLQGKLKFAE
jgi:hypothetical protein